MTRQGLYVPMNAYFGAKMAVFGTNIFFFRERAKIWMPPTFHIAHLNRHTHKISGKTDLETTVRRSGLPKSGNPDSCVPKQAILRVFLYKTNFPGEIVNFCLKHVVSVNFGFLGTLYVHPVTCQIFCDMVGQKWHHQLKPCRNQIFVDGALYIVTIFAVGPITIFLFVPELQPLKHWRPFLFLKIFTRPHSWEISVYH